jgi:hypothetical protein
MPASPVSSPAPRPNGGRDLASRINLLAHEREDRAHDEADETLASDDARNEDAVVEHDRGPLRRGAPDRLLKRSDPFHETSDVLHSGAEVLDIGPEDRHIASEEEHLALADEHRGPLESIKRADVQLNVLFVETIASDHVIKQVPDVMIGVEESIQHAEVET